MVNPYEPPRAVDPAPPRMLFWGLLGVGVASLAGGLVGAIAGIALGAFAPDYYRSVFARGGSPGFDPIAVGLGQGLTQGLAGGAAIGLVLALLYFRYRAQMLRIASSAKHSS